MLACTEFQVNLETSKEAPRSLCTTASGFIPKAGEKQGRSKEFKTKRPCQQALETKAILEGLLGHFPVQPKVLPFSLQPGAVGLSGHSGRGGHPAAESRSV